MVDISAMMVVAALRMVEVVGAAGSPRHRSWYLAIGLLRCTRGETYLPSEVEQSLRQSSLSFSKVDWHSRFNLLGRWVRLYGGP